MSSAQFNKVQFNEASLICHKCIGDEELRRIIRKDGSIGQCVICKKRHRCITLGDLSDLVDSAYKRYYKPGSIEPIPSIEGDGVEYEQEGDPPEDIIAEMTGTTTDIAYAILDILSKRDAIDVRDGADDYYEQSARYVQIDMYPHEEHYIWTSFCNRLKFVRRFYDEESRALLSGLLGNIRNINIDGMPSPVRIFRPDDESVHIYRARRARDKSELKKIIENPYKELGPPPSTLGYGGRMNPPGIVAFYGGLSKEVCISEVRPVVGEYVVVGEFKTLRELKLLDLNVFEGPLPTGSMFDDKYYERTTRWRFLRSFQNIISRPIQPHEENIEYLPTQAVAEYLANVLEFDGLIYLSAQAGQQKPDNIVLFSRAALIEEDSGTTSVKKQKSASEKKEHRLAIFSLERDLKEWEEKPHAVLRYVKDSAQIFKITSADYKYDLIPQYLATMDEGRLREIDEWDG